MTKQAKNLSTIHVAKHSVIKLEQATYSIDLNDDDTGDTKSSFQQRTSPIYGL